MENILNDIRREFNDKVAFQEKRPGIYQLYLPIYHEDGDMIDIFLVPKGKDKYELCDFGQTIMRLSYSYQIDTENKEAILQKILTENQLVEDDGNIKFETHSETIFSDIMHVTQAYAKIGSMRYFKREVIESLFFEMLDEFIFKNLTDFKPERDVLPVPSRDDLAVDFVFTPNGHPVYLLGVKDKSTAMLATIKYLEFHNKNLNFRGWVVYEDFDKIPRSDQKRLTNASDKQFTSLEDFMSQAKVFFERERQR
jgi:hypothetical protein